MKISKKITRLMGRLALACAFAILVPQISSRAETGGGEDDPAGTCKAQADCYSWGYNPSNMKWEKMKDGEVTCTGKKSCSSGTEYVECDGTRTSCSAG